MRLFCLIIVMCVNVRRETITPFTGENSTPHFNHPIRWLVPVSYDDLVYKLNGIVEKPSFPHPFKNIT